MAEGRVAQIVGQRQRLGQVLVEPQRAGDGARDLRHLEAVGQARAVVVALVEHEHLRLVGEAPEGGGVHDAVAVALEGGAHRAGGLGMDAAGARLGLGCVGSQRPLSPLAGQAPCLIALLRWLPSANPGLTSVVRDPMYQARIAAQSYSQQRGPRGQITMASMSQPVTVSERAARRIAQIVAAEPTTPMLRVSVEGGGCSGFQYKFDLVGTRDPDDTVIERDGAQVLIDAVSLGYLAGSEIDFVDDLIGQSFKITNPNATASCGCGTSFSI